MPAHDAATICETLEPLLAAYALGAEDAPTRALIEEHVRDCAACRHNLTAYQHTARLLPFGLSAALPRPELRAHVLDAVEQAANGQTPAHAQRRSSTPFGGMRWWQALGALVLLVSLAFNGVLYRNLAAEQNQKQQQTTALATLLQNAAVERQTLAAAPSASEARGTLLVARDQQTVALVVQQLPVLSAGRVYQLWLLQHGTRTSGGTFTVDTDGCGFLVVQAPLSIDVYDGVGVTIEPPGGSTTPTSPRVIGGALRGRQAIVTDAHTKRRTHMRSPFGVCAMFVRSYTSCLSTLRSTESGPAP